MLEKMLCEHINVVRHSNRGEILTVSKVFRKIWREFRDVYLDICPHDYITCRDSGVFIVRNYLLKMIYDHESFPDTDPVIHSVREHLRGNRCYPPYCSG